MNNSMFESNKITLPDDLGGDDICIMTVDGTHCAVEEPNHHIWSQDREFIVTSTIDQVSTTS